MNKFLYSIKYRIYLIRQYFVILRRYCGCDFLMINVPDHGNLGDQAIAIAEKIFFDEQLPEMKYSEVTGDYYRRNKNAFKRLLGSGITLGISGGGYLGNLWMDEENLVRDVLRDFPENKIVIFPQTVFYRPDDQGKKEWDFTRKLYLEHTELIFVLKI